MEIFVICSFLSILLFSIFAVDVKIIVPGLYVATKDGAGTTFQYVTNVVLITDEDTNIIFDTGFATDEVSRHKILRELETADIDPDEIDYVVLSHYHTDHTGNVNLFPNAKIIHQDFSISGITEKFIGIYKTGKYDLSPNVRIIPTPGHTSTCISAIVSNTSKGKIAITGDLFLLQGDIKNVSIWQSASSNVDQQEKTRQKILCSVDYIIPGHGPMFKAYSCQSCLYCSSCKDCITRRSYNGSCASCASCKSCTSCVNCL